MLTSCDVIYRWQKIRNHNFHQSIQRLYRNSHDNKTNRISSTASSIFPPSMWISFHRTDDLLHSKFTYTAADSSYLIMTVPLATLDINKSSTITVIWFLIYNVFFFSGPMLPPILLWNCEKLRLCYGFEPFSQAAERSHQNNLEIKAVSKTFHPCLFEVI